VDTGSGKQAKLLTLHLQLLSEELVLHTNCSTGSFTLPILKESSNNGPGNNGSGGKGSGTAGGSCGSNARSSEPLRDTVMLKTKCQHQNITIDELNHAWVHGRVDWLSQTSPSFPNIMFCDSNKTCDVKSVDMTPGSCPQWPCSCLNPWEPPPLILHPGDFVELIPVPGQHHVDSLTRLARVIEVIEDEKPLVNTTFTNAAINVGSDPSCGSFVSKENVPEQEVNPFFLKPHHSAAILVQVFSLIQRGEGQITYDFVLQKGQKDLKVPMKNVLRKLELEFHLAPGARLFDSDSTEIIFRRPAHAPAAAIAPLSTNQPELLTPVPLSPLLECIDLFCGMGGLSTGLELSGIAKVVVGVDGFRAATETFRQAHPDATVACEDVCQFLMGKYGAKLERRASGGGGAGSGSKDAAAKMNQEQQRSMRLLVGGPPCQGFSGANKSSPSQKLEKNVCMAIFTEAVSRLRPEFVIIENVKGLLRAPNGVLDSVILCLVSLGYQTRVRVVNAGCYGVAQHRVRVILLAAKHGLPLPDIPRPTHIFHAGGYNAKDPSQPCNIQLRQRCAYAGVPVAWQGCVIVPTNALLPRENIKSIIGDLPIQDEVESGEVAYTSEPKSVFQANIRRGVASSNKVYNHRTNGWTIGVKTEDRIKAIPKESDFGDVERTFEGRVLACETPQIPVMSGDWRDIPFDLLPDELQATTARTLMKNWGRFGRLMWKSHCSTILTQSCIQINSDTCGPVIHPEGDRVLTVREVARVQGIPDGVKISGSLVEMYKQCGNGVPSPLAEAIGREIKKAVCEVYRRNATP
jgi:DNA-cytosine methyltransferase